MVGINGEERAEQVGVRKAAALTLEVPVLDPHFG